MKLFSIVIVSSLLSLSASAQLTSPQNREALFQKAKVWLPPSTPISQVDFKKTKGGELDGQVIDCTFKPGNLSGGVTPKFKCLITSGIFKDRVIKVKYGPGDDNEISNEVFGMRLLNALGFGTDDVYLPKEIRCKGCPKNPYDLLRCISNRFPDQQRQCISIYQDFLVRGSDGKVTVVPPENLMTVFNKVSAELAPINEKIESKKDQGWSFKELSKINPAVGGASRAEVDAMVIMGFFISNADTKSDNQRLQCLDQNFTPGNDCRQPIAFMHDLGDILGPRSHSVKSWSAGRMWADGPRDVCLLQKFSGNRGASLEAIEVSEGGRKLVSEYMTQMSDTQIRELFSAATFEAQDLDAWVNAFKSRVKQIAEKGPCRIN